MSETPHVVLHTAPDGRSLATGGARGQLLVFREAANAEAFARGLVDGGLPEAIVAGLDDVDGPGAAERPGEVAVFEECVADLGPRERGESARRLGLELGPSLLARY
jgi:hypothetical protein